jgi:hypothetical protein
VTGEAYTGFWWENPKKKRDPGVDGKIILRWIFRKCDVVYGIDRDGSE